MQRKMLLYVNPISGTRSKKAFLPAIENQISQAGIPYELLYTNAGGEYSYLPEKIETESITDIVIIGGDGTIGKITRFLVEVDVNIGIIPMGSGNGLALAAKIPTDPLKAIDVILNGKGRYIDAFFVNQTFACMLAGLGFDAQVAHDFAKESSRGLKTYLRQTIYQFFVADPYPFELVHDGHSFRTDAYFISIANSNQFGNRVTIAPKASLSDGKLDIVLVKKMSKIRLLWAVARQLWKGTPDDWHDPLAKEKDILYFQTDKLMLFNTGNAPIHIDGDPAPGAKKINIQIVPQAFRLIQPL